MHILVESRLPSYLFLNPFFFGVENNHRNSTSSFAYKNEPLGGTPFIRLLKNKLCVWSNFPVHSRRQLFFCLQWVLDLIVAIHYVVNDRANDHAHFSIILSFHMEHSLILQIFLLIFIKWSFCFILIISLTASTIHITKT